MAKKLSVIGIGPGSREMMTVGALDALEKSTVIVGYHVYVDLVKDSYPNKRLITTPMKKESERCVLALQEG